MLLQLVIECEWQLVIECEWQLVIECEWQLVLACEWQLVPEYHGEEESAIRLESR